MPMRAVVASILIGASYLGAQSTASVPDYHSNAEQLLPLFTAAISRLEREKINTGPITKLSEEASRAVHKLNKTANEAIRNELRDEMSKLNALSEASVRAHERVAQAASAGKIGPAEMPAMLSQAERADEAAKVYYQAVTAKFSAIVAPEEAKTIQQIAGLLDQTTAYATERGVTSLLKVITPKPGAVVWLQSLGERIRSQKGKSLSELTSLQQAVPIGYYFIYTERNGIVTSDKDRQIAVMDPEVKVEIPEQIR